MELKVSLPPYEIFYVSYLRKYGSFEKNFGYIYKMSFSAILRFSQMKKEIFTKFSMLKDYIRKDITLRNVVKSVTVINHFMLLV